MRAKDYVRSDKFARDRYIDERIDEIFDAAIWRLTCLREATILMVNRASMCEHMRPANHNCAPCGRKVQ